LEERNVNNITRWNSFRSFPAVQDRLNRIFEDALHGGSDESSVATWAPAVDIYETENDLVLKADIPDLEEKDLDVRIENNMLTVRGERKFEQKVKQENYLRIERTYGSFVRSFALPNTVSMENIRAEYKNGVLTVEMPKRAESKPKQVKISVSGNGKNDNHQTE
jgi:HSP20 family protein